MLWQQQQVRDNLRTREGQRVFFLPREDSLTWSARDWLRREGIPILPGDQGTPTQYRLLAGGTMQEKPESMTHLSGTTLVPKNHPRIVFRGKLDTLESALLLAGQEPGAPMEGLGELLELTRQLLKCEVLDTPLEDRPILGLTPEELRHRSHFPQRYYGKPHFMPDFSQGPAMARLNAARCCAREAEIAAVTAFPEGQRPDILKAMNRLSSAIYLLMLQLPR